MPHAPTATRPMRVVIESPYAGDTPLHVDYARAALLDSLGRGEAPIASHLLLTQVLDDNNPDERTRGLQAGHAWIAQADQVVFYQDLGFSAGMEQGLAMAERAGIRCEVRYLGGRWAATQGGASGERSPRRTRDGIAAHP